MWTCIILCLLLSACNATRFASFKASDETKLAVFSTEDDLVETAKKKMKPVKVIFLDVDGPLVTYTMTSYEAVHYAFQKRDALNQPPFKKHADAISAVVKAAGGPEVVKIVLSSNWRTYPERYTWIVNEFKEKYGIEVVGMTPVAQIYPDPNGAEGNIVKRDILIKHVMATGSFATSFDLENKDGKDNDKQCSVSSFEARGEKVVGWVAVDDLDLVDEEMPFDAVTLYGGCVELLGEKHPQAPSWTILPEIFKGNALRSGFVNHFVLVYPGGENGGIGGTPGAQEKMIEKLNAGL